MYVEDEAIFYSKIVWDVLGFSWRSCHVVLCSKESYWRVCKLARGGFELEFKEYPKIEYFKNNFMSWSFKLPLSLGCGKIEIFMGLFSNENRVIVELYRIIVNGFYFILNK